MSDTLHTRRKFLRTSILGGAMAWTVPVFIEKTFGALDAQAAASATQFAVGKDSPILIVLQLAGGNDGLNTVIPYADDAYFGARPKIAIPAKDVLRLGDYAGLNPNLKNLADLYHDGHMAVLQGVGYPNPNRSHFRSTEIWQTASDSNRVEREGWLGRYFDSCCAGEDPGVGINIGRDTPQAFTAKTPKGISFERPEEFRLKVEGSEEASELDNAGGSIGMLSGPVGGTSDTLDYVRRTSLDAKVSSDRIQAILAAHTARVSYPGTQLARSLSTVAGLIAGGMATRVYYVAQGGYDTHSNQGNSHERLLGEMDAALAAFVADLKAQGAFDRVVIMTFSEFGRRVAENASGGTDHGMAAPMFVMGGKVKAGMFGAYPSLTKLNDGDLIYNLDFRSVYATILDRWLKAPSQAVLGKKFPMTDFLV